MNIRRLDFQSEGNLKDMAKYIELLFNMFCTNYLMVLMKFTQIKSIIKGSPSHRSNRSYSFTLGQL